MSDRYRYSNADIARMLQQLLERIENSPNSAALEELRRLQAVQAEQLKQLTQTVDKIAVVLYGNGKNGLVMEVSHLREEISRGQIVKNASITVIISLVISSIFYLVLMHGADLIR